jgi:hypothetical protein
MVERRDRDSHVSVLPLPLPAPSLRELRPILAGILTEQTRVKVAEQHLQLSRYNVKVVVPSREELERKRPGQPLYTLLLVSNDPIPMPGPSRFSTLPLPIPRPLRDRFARLVAGLVQEQTGTRLSPREVSLIGENGKVALNPDIGRREIDRTPLHGVLFISIDPQPIF